MTTRTALISINGTPALTAEERTLDLLEERVNEYKSVLFFANPKAKVTVTYSSKEYHDAT